MIEYRFTCGSCGGCPSDTLCDNCNIATLKSNGISEDLANETKGLKRKSWSHGGSFQFSELYYKLRELMEREHGE